MTMRIIYSFIFISQWQKDNKLDEESKPGERVTPFSILPNKLVLAVLGCVFVCGLASAYYSPTAFVHLAIGGILFGCFITIVFVSHQ